jgi:DNA-binding HxlR family transcriptional regulator
MAQQQLSHLDGSIARASEIIGDQWTILIVRDAFYGVTRFNDFSDDLGIAKNTLSTRLRLLVAQGILTKRSYTDHPPRDEYLLTDKGRALYPVLVAMMHWGDEWSHATQVPHSIKHIDCGGNGIHAVAACSGCGGELLPNRVRLDPPPQTVTRVATEHIDSWRTAVSA